MGAGSNRECICSLILSSLTIRIGRAMQSCQHSTLRWYIHAHVSNSGINRGQGEASSLAAPSCSPHAPTSITTTRRCRRPGCRRHLGLLATVAAATHILKLLEAQPLDAGQSKVAMRRNRFGCEVTEFAAVDSPRLPIFRQVALLNDQQRQACASVSL
jgi:hypothetical protein